VAGGTGAGSGPGGGSSGGASPSGGTSGGVASGGSSSGGGGSSSGTTGTIGGGSTGGPQGCDPGTYPVSTTVNSFGAAGSGTPIADATVTELGRNGTPLSIAEASAVSDATGTVNFCVPLNIPVTLQIVATNYPQTYIEEIDATNDAGPSTLLQKGLQLILSSELSALSTILDTGAGPPVDLTKGIVFAAVISVSQQLPCGDESGWTLGVDFLDGGTLADGGPLPYQIAYLGPDDLPSISATLTSSNGYAVIYNIDPTITNVAQLTATNVDGGSCPTQNAPEMVTGRVAIETSSVTFAPYFIQ
jgi:hypothetical protein